MVTAKAKHRISLALSFFLSGFCFASWASRIPTIRDAFDYNEAELGTILLTMPVASLIGLPISGWLVSKFDTRIPMAAGFLVHSTSLILIAFANTTAGLVSVIFVFAFSMRIQNIAMNTQSIHLQKHFDKKILGAFHGFWSLGGLAGVGLTTLFVAQDVSIITHLLLVGIATVVIILTVYPAFLQQDRSTEGNKLILGKPDGFIMSLGLILLLAAICEGGMFDWSGIYFQQVIGVEIFTAGYLMFMTSMALSRFLSDSIISRFGMKRIYLASSLLIFSGIGLAVIFPHFWTAMAGFVLVGFGTAAVVPMTFALAGESKKYSPGMAISIIATYGMVGILAGPPIIGYLAHAFGLRISFVLFMVAGFLMIPVSRRIFLKYGNELRAGSR